MANRSTVESSFVLYYYVGYVGDKQKKPTEEDLYRNLLITFWEQAARNNDDGSTNVSHSSMDSKSIEEYLLKLLSSLSSKIYIMVDGVDHLPQSACQDVFQWLEQLGSTLKNQKEFQGLSIAISSRAKKVENELGAYEGFQIEVTQSQTTDDIRSYLDMNLKSTLLQKDIEFKNSVSVEVATKAKGMLVPCV